MNTKNKYTKILIIALVVLVIAEVGFYYTHRSVDQEKTASDINLIKQIEQVQDESRPLITDTSKGERPVRTVDDITVNTPKNKKRSSQPSSNPQVIPTTQKETTTGVQILKKGTFNPDAVGSDRFHKGWGDISIAKSSAGHSLVFSENFKVTNGPDYYIYLSTTKDIDTKEKFFAARDDLKQLTRLRQFSGSQVFSIPQNIKIDNIQGVVIWCEQFSQFISVANLD